MTTQEILLNLFGLKKTQCEIDYFRIKERLEYEGMTFKDLGYIKLSDFVPLPLHKYGIEIEGLLAPELKGELKRRLNELGIKTEIVGYNGGRINTFVALGRDSSVDDNGNDVEITTPQLIGWGQKGMQIIKKIVETWKDLQGQVNQRCGLHVHVDTFYYKKKDYKRLLIWLYFCQPFIFSILPRSRWNNTYCKVLVPEIVKRFLDYISLQSFTRDDRYYVINFANMKKRHIELRVFNGTLNYNKIESYLLLSLELVRAVKEKWKQVRSFLLLLKDRVSFSLEEFQLWLDLLDIRGTHPVRERVRALLLERWYKYAEEYFEELKRIPWRVSPRKAWEELETVVDITNLL